MLTLECVFCGHGNSAGARFCNQCGGVLADEPARLHYADADPWLNPAHGTSVITALQSRLDADAHESGTTPVELVQRVRPFAASVTLLSSAAQRMAHVVPVRVHEERARIGLVNRVGVPLLLAATVSAVVYWAYSLPAPTAQSPRANQPSIRASATPASNSAAGAAGASAAAAVVPVDGQGSPAVQGRIRTGDPKGNENASNAVVATASSAPRAEEAARMAHPQADRASIIAHVPKRESRDPVLHKQTPREADSANASPDTYRLLMRMSPGVDSPSALRDDGRRTCTSEVAALGLCALRADVKP